MCLFSLCSSNMDQEDWEEEVLTMKLAALEAQNKAYLSMRLGLHCIGLILIYDASRNSLDQKSCYILEYLLVKLPLKR